MSILSDKIRRLAGEVESRSDSSQRPSTSADGALSSINRDPSILFDWESHDGRDQFGIIAVILSLIMVNGRVVSEGLSFQRSDRSAPGTDPGHPLPRTIIDLAGTIRS